MSKKDINLVLVDDYMDKFSSESSIISKIIKSFTNPKTNKLLLGASIASIASVVSIKFFSFSSFSMIPMIIMLLLSILMSKAYPRIIFPGKFARMFDRIRKKVRDFFDRLRRRVRAWVNKIWAKIKRAIRDFFNRLMKKIRQQWERFKRNRIMRSIANKLNWVKKSLVNFRKWVKSTYKYLNTEGKRYLRTRWNLVRNYVNSRITKFNNLKGVVSFRSWVNELRGDWKILKNNFTSKVTQITQNVRAFGLNIKTSVLERIARNRLIKQMLRARNKIRDPTTFYNKFFRRVEERFKKIKSNISRSSRFMKTGGLTAQGLQYTMRGLFALGLIIETVHLTKEISEILEGRSEHSILGSVVGAVGEWAVIGGVGYGIGAGIAALTAGIVTFPVWAVVAAAIVVTAGVYFLVNWFTQKIWDKSVREIFRDAGDWLAENTWVGSKIDEGFTWLSGKIKGYFDRVRENHSYFGPGVSQEDIFLQGIDPSGIGSGTIRTGPINLGPSDEFSNSLGILDPDDVKSRVAASLDAASKSHLKGLENSRHAFMLKTLQSENLFTIRMNNKDEILDPIEGHSPVIYFVEERGNIMWPMWNMKFVLTNMLKATHDKHRRKINNSITLHKEDVARLEREIERLRRRIQEERDRARAARDARESTGV